MSENIGRRIKEFREQHLGLKSGEFVRKLGITPNYLYEIESGRKNASESLLLLIECSYAINSAWLRKDEGEMCRSIPSHPINPDIPQAQREYVDKLLAILEGSNQKLAGKIEAYIEMYYEEMRKEEEQPLAERQKTGA